MSRVTVSGYCRACHRSAIPGDTCEQVPCAMGEPDGADSAGVDAPTASGAATSGVSIFDVPNVPDSPAPDFSGGGGDTGGGGAPGVGW